MNAAGWEAVDLKKFSIGYRTLKTAVGAAIAIAIAQYFELASYASAGILTILCVQPTKKKSLHAAYTRFVASIIGMLYAFLSFELFSYHPLTLAGMLVLFIPTIVSLKVADGFVSSAVIIMHIYAAKGFSYDLVTNELALMAIGYGTGIAINMYMPDIQKELNYYRVKIEELYSKIFLEIASYLRQGDTLWDGQELIQAFKTLNDAKSLAFKDVENHFTRRQNDYYVYFDMREQQLEIIERVLPKITALPVIVQEAEIVADFVQDLGEHVHSGNTAGRYREKLELAKRDFAKLPLPTNHQEFIAQAALYQFIEEMDRYLEIKQSFKGLKVERKRPQ
ncbi:aromatic acid exporter family protein [Lysinibacillus sphaericus]|uniref:aromatic acid exporter family protein n=1 Tax=Lysinibacillus sphaericus TaxID=1421 RepID=UPI001E446998|nr:aromatic acid exporter family protein [Lysinibacillus sphaericus]